MVVSRARTCSIACVACRPLMWRSTRREWKATGAPRSSGHKAAARKLNDGGIGKSRACGVCRAWLGLGLRVMVEVRARVRVRIELECEPHQHEHEG